MTNPSWFAKIHFINVIIQKVIKSKFVNDYRTCVRMKKKMITQHNSLYTITKEWFYDSIWKTKESNSVETKFPISTKNKKIMIYVSWQENKGTHGVWAFLHFWVKTGCEKCCLGPHGNHLMYMWVEVTFTSMKHYRKTHCDS